jgi:hypothetical protein
LGKGKYKQGNYKADVGKFVTRKRVISGAELFLHQKSHENFWLWTVVIVEFKECKMNILEHDF